MFVTTGDNWTEVLEDYLNNKFSCRKYKKIEVINLGEYGYDIQYSVERYRIRGIKYNPDLVLWLLKDDDFKEINEIMRIHEQEYVSEMKKNGNYERLLKQGNPYPPNTRLHIDMENYRKRIGEEKMLNIQQGFIKDFTHYYDNKLVIITFPFTKTKYQKLIENIVSNKRNWFFFNKITDIYKKTDFSFLPYDGHPNKQGHKAIAKSVFDYLILNKIIPCN
jgi:hypothetical protein